MKSDLAKISLFIIASFAVGWGFGYPLVFALIASIVGNLWILKRAVRLHRWFNNKDETPHAEKGVFYQLHRDIRAMRKKNRAHNRTLQKNLQQYRNASGAIPDAIVVFEKNGEINWANSLAEELLGIQNPRDKGQRITNLIRTPAFVEAFTELHLKPVNIDIKAPNQHNKSINLKIVDLAENNQMLVARDITRLTGINQAQKDFVTNVSHELKTPLTVMRGYLEMLGEHPQLSSQLTKPVSDMTLQTQRMQSTIDDLLYIAKLEGQSDPKEICRHHETLAIDSIVDMIMDAARPLAEQKQQNIDIQINDQLVIEGNRSELQIAFNNLIINAIRYTPEEGNITIKWHHRSTDAVFSVSDNGIGIAPNHIANLTKRFYRVDQGRSRHKGGTGLGLAIVKNVLDRHKAKLNINSNLGSGSCFECVFPRN